MLQRWKNEPSGNNKMTSCNFWLYAFSAHAGREKRRVPASGLISCTPPRVFNNLRGLLTQGGGYYYGISRAPRSKTMAPPSSTRAPARKTEAPTRKTRAPPRTNEGQVSHFSVIILPWADQGKTPDLHHALLHFYWLMTIVLPDGGRVSDVLYFTCKVCRPFCHRRVSVKCYCQEVRARRLLVGVSLCS